MKNQNRRRWCAVGIVLACLLNCSPVSAGPLVGHYDNTTITPPAYTVGTTIMLLGGHVDTLLGGAADDLQFQLTINNGSSFDSSQMDLTTSDPFKFSFVYNLATITFSVTDPATLTPLGGGTLATISADLTADTDLTGTGLEDLVFATFTISLPQDNGGVATWEIDPATAFVPEPSSWVLALSGLLVLAGMSWAKVYRSARVMSAES
jgi:hypothetical protein